MKAGDDDCKTVVPGTHRGHRRRIGGVLGLSDSFVGRGDANSARRAADGARCLGRSAARLYIASVARGAAAAS
jgi:hypothetical protein